MLDCSKYSDVEVVSKISSWDVDAFYCLVEKYEQKLLKYISRITNVDSMEVENILQEVFIKAYTKINSYNSDYSFSSWIYRIAHNHTIDYFKKNKKHLEVNINSSESTDENINFLELIESDESVENNVSSKELNIKIWEIINSLDVKYKEILILKFLEEKNYREISDILKIPEWTVATLINRGKKQFKQKAEEQNLINYL